MVNNKKYERLDISRVSQWYHNMALGEDYP